MPRYVHDSFKNLIMTGQANVLSETVNVQLVSDAYTPNPATDTYAGLSGVVLDTPVTLSSKTVSSDGTFDAADVTFTAVASGTANGYVMYISGGGNDGTVILSDTTIAPVVANGGDINLNFNASGIFQI